MKLFSGTPLSQFAQQPAPAARKPFTAQGSVAPAGPAPKPLSQQVKDKLAKPRHALPKLDELLPPPATPRISAIARLAQGGRWKVEAMRAYSEPVLYWFTRGQGRITVGGVTRGYGAHNAVFVPAGVMHGFDLGAQVYGQALFFGRATQESLPAKPLHLRVRDGAAQSELSILLEAVQRELDTGRAGNDRAAQLHIGLVGVWLDRQAQAPHAEDKAPDAATRLVERFSALLEQGFRSAQGVADYAETLGVTPTHLTRVCKETSGRPASELISDRKIFEARRLLSETALPVNAVSEALGFSSPAYFTRAFQHRTGKTPSAFRRDA